MIATFVLLGSFLPFAMRGDCEIEMMVVPAARVECRLAMRAAGIRVEVVRDGQLSAAGTAEHGWRFPFGWRPWLDGMVGQGVMAVFAGVIRRAAFHFDGHNIEWRMVVEAARLGVEI
jgi:hypothetical protein